MTRAATVTKATAHALATGDFVLRLAFFAFAPFLFLFFSFVAPIGPIVINLVITLVLLFTFELVKKHVERFRLAKLLLKKHILLVEYYRERAPRPFAYYLFFPILAPYWLVSKDARRELNLYRRYVVANVVLLVVFKLVEYERLWAPDIRFRPFLVECIAGLVFQTAFVLAVVLPTMVTVVDCRAKKRHRRLAAYVLAAAVTSTLATIAYFKRPTGSFVSLQVCSRMRERTTAAPDRARAAQLEALSEVEAHADEATRIQRRSGFELEGPPLDRARAALTSFYREDETECFRLFEVESSDGSPAYVLRAEIKKKKSSNPLWIGIKAGRKTGRVVDDVADLAGGDKTLEDVRKKP